MVLIEEWIANCFNEEHPIKALVPIYDTEDGIESSVSEEQFSKQKQSILFIDGGIKILFKDEQFFNEQLPICSTEDGIEILVIEEQFSKQ